MIDGSTLIHMHQQSAELIFGTKTWCWNREKLKKAIDKWEQKSKENNQKWKQQTETLKYAIKHIKIYINNQDIYQIRAGQT